MRTALVCYTCAPNRWQSNNFLMGTRELIKGWTERSTAMSLAACVRIALAGCVYLAGSNVAALGLGEVEVLSTLGRPLVAELALIVGPAEAIDRKEVSVKLADAASHRRSGLGYPLVLAGSSFVIDLTERPVVRLTTREAIAEPLLAFLVELRWPQGRLLKDVTILLDPPPADTPPKPAAMRPTPASKPKPSVEPATRVRLGVTPLTYGPVAAGETLSAVANKLTAGRSIDARKLMWALFEHNPQAFGDSMDVLKTGAVLAVPKAAEIAQARPPRTAEGAVAVEAKLPAQDPVAQIGAPEAEDSAGHLYIVGPEMAADAAAIQRSEHAEAKGVAKSTSGSAPIDYATQARLEQTEGELERMRTENAQIRESMARLHNELLATQSRLDKTLQEYDRLMTAKQQAAAAPVNENATAVMSWLLALFVLGLSGGLLMIGFRRRQAHAQWVRQEASSVSSTTAEGVEVQGGKPAEIGQVVPVDEAQTEKPEAATGACIPLAAQRAAPKHRPSEAEKLRAAKASEASEGEVIAEYVSTGEFNLTDSSVHEEIIHAEGNDELKLLLLTFYKELDRHNELQELAERILQHHPESDHDFRAQVKALVSSKSQDHEVSEAIGDTETLSSGAAPSEAQPLDTLVSDSTQQRSSAESDAGRGGAQNRTGEETEVYEPDGRAHELMRGGREGLRRKPETDAPSDETPAMPVQDSWADNRSEDPTEIMTTEDEQSAGHTVVLDEVLLEQEREPHADTAIYGEASAHGGEPTQQLSEMQEFAPGMPDVSLWEQADTAGSSAESDDGDVDETDILDNETRTGPRR